MEKVVVNQAQGKAIDELINTWKHSDPEHRNKMLINEKLNHGWKLPKFEAANSLSLTDFVTALIVGYKVELTPNQELVQYFHKNVKGIGCDDDWDRGYDEGWKDGVRKTLKAYGKDPIDFNL